jgi:ubiquinone/menaquinone biosynthesis C-methylase UbiE
VFRGAFDRGLSKLGASVHHRRDDHNEVVIVDFGCGTGKSTRTLAKQYPQATIKLIGIDLSPYFIDVGQTLLKLAPSAIDASRPLPTGWITAIDSDERIQLRQGDIANTPFPSDSVSVVNLSMVLHELPISAAKEVILEAYRILEPGGQLWISEMDFESPAYKAQRENALLFSLLRPTEPYLDEYADGMTELRNFMADIFAVVKITAATGRHYSLVAEKTKDGVSDKDSRRQTVIEDYRFREDGSYAVDDTHLKPWESSST